MISNCPKCSRQVSLPLEADADALVRCPLCAAEYELREALVLAPPELILVAPRIQPIVESPVSTERLVVEERAVSVSQGKAAWRPRRQKSALQTIFEVLAGGLAGVVVAYYGLAIYFGGQFHRVGLPHLPLPFISWITAPPAQGDPAAQPAGEEPPPPSAGDR